MNSLASSRTCAYFSQGANGGGGGGGGPLNSVLADHSWGGAGAVVSTHRRVGAHLNMSELRPSRRSTTKSIVSPWRTWIFSILGSAFSLCSDQVPSTPDRLERIRAVMPSPASCSW